MNWNGWECLMNNRKRMMLKCELMYYRKGFCRKPIGKYDREKIRKFCFARIGECGEYYIR